MGKKELDCYIVYTADEHCSEYIDDHYKFREYLSGFTGSAGTLLVTMDDAGLWTDGRYYIQAERELAGSGIRLYKAGQEGVIDVSEYTGNLARKARTKGCHFNTGADFTLISATACRKLKKICADEGGSLKDIDLANVLWKDRPQKTCNPVYRIGPELSGRLTEDKLASIRSRLIEFKADAVVLTDLGDVMWTFNIRGSDIMYNPVAVSYGLIGRDEAYLFLQNGCCPPELKEEFEKEGISVADYEAFDDYLATLKGKRILCDNTTMNARVMEELNGNELINRRSYEFVDKHIKNDTEIELARNWHIEDGLAVTRFVYKIKKCVREDSVPINEYGAANLLDDMRKNIPGNLGLSFETISAYGSNGAIIHYSPYIEGSAQLKSEGFLLVDSGGQYEGATTDITRTIALGTLTEEMRRDYTSVLKGVLDLADAVFPEGIRGENLDILARRPIWERYIDYRHGTGHGVGAQLSVHEGPQSFKYRIDKNNIQPPFKPGMITSDEPGIYLEGEYGIRIENLLVCVEKNSNEWGRFLGFETLTMVPYEREAIIPEMLTIRQRDIINDYHRTIYSLYSERLDEGERMWLSEVTAPI